MTKPKRTVCIPPRRLALIAAPALLLQAGPAAAQLLIDEGRADRPAQQETAVPRAESPAARSVDVEAEAAGAPLREVRVQGSSAPSEQFVPIWSPFTGRPLNRDTIAEIANAVSAAYEESGAVIYTVVAPAQDLSGGVLTLNIVEGYVERVTLAGDVEGRDLSLVRAYAEKLTEERPLLRPTLERYLSLMRDIPGLTVEAEFLNGETRGGVVLALTLDQDRIEVDSSLNSSGSSLLGRTQVTGTVDLFALLRQGDRTTLSVTAPTAFDNFFYVSAAHRTPVGHEGMSLRIRASHLESEPESLPVKGEATTAGLELNYPLVRGYKQNVSLVAAADMLNSSNAVLGRFFSSERVRALRAGASWSKSGDTTFTSAGGVVSSGIDGMGARVSPLRGEEGFLKLSVNGAHNRAFGESLVLRLRAAAQVAANDLPVSEQYSLGGLQYGRAFPASSALGDDALAGSAEFAWIPDFMRGSFAGTELYVFADAAQAWTRARPLAPSQTDDMVSAGAGVRLAWDESMLGLEFAYGLDAPAGVGDDAWRVLLSWRIAP